MWLPWPLHPAAARSPRTCASKHHLTLSCRDTQITRRSCARPVVVGCTTTPLAVVWCARLCRPSPINRPSFRGALDRLVWSSWSCLHSFFLSYSVQRWPSWSMHVWHLGLVGCRRVSRKNKERHVAWFVVCAGCQTHVTLFDHTWFQGVEERMRRSSRRKSFQRGRAAGVVKL